MLNLSHTITEIAPHTWQVSEFNLVNAYLLEGDTHFALIDTGCGIGNIYEAIQPLLTKPLIVLLTHAHPDHNGGMYTIPPCIVYMSEFDRPLKESFVCNNEMRTFYVTTRVPIRYPGEGHVDALLRKIPVPEPITNYATTPCKDNDIIELGNRALRVIHTPGHSPGSLCFLDTTTRILFSGDTINPDIILMRRPNNDTTLILEYHNSLQKLWNERNAFDTLAIGHDGATKPRQMIADYLTLTSGLLNGTLLGEYEEVGFRKGNVVRHGLAELWYQCDA